MELLVGMLFRWPGGRPGAAGLGLLDDGRPGAAGLGLLVDGPDVWIGRLEGDGETGLGEKSAEDDAARGVRDDAARGVRDDAARGAAWMLPSSS